MTSSRIKLIIEKGPREGETLEYNSASVIKIGRVIRGNTIAIKDAGISSKHICIQFDNQLLKWTLIDLDSSNGTILNELNVEPHVSSCLNDGDCIKIGELTCVIVKIESEFSELGLGFDEVEEVPKKRNLRSRGRKVAAAAVENEIEKAVEEKPNLRARGTEIVAVEHEKEKEVVQKRNLRGRKNAAVEEVVKKPNLRGKGKKGVDVKIELESLSCKRVLRSSKKENMNIDVVEDSDLVENGVPVQGKRTGRGRKKMVVESLVDNNDAKECVGVDEGKNEDEFDKGKADLAEKLVLRQEGCEGKEVMVDGSLIKGPYKIADLDKEKVVAAEEMVYRQDGCEGLENDSGPDKSRWVDLEKMTLGDFFDYMEVKLPKEIHDKIEKINSDLKENARKCHEFRLQINETRNSNIAAD